MLLGLVHDGAGVHAAGRGSRGLFGDPVGGDVQLPWLDVLTFYSRSFFRAVPEAVSGLVSS